MRPHDALALKPDLLGDALRSKVLGIGDEVDASQPEILERVASEKAKRACARPSKFQENQSRTAPPLGLWRRCESPRERP